MQLLSKTAKKVLGFRGGEIGSMEIKIMSMENRLLVPSLVTSLNLQMYSGTVVLKTGTRLVMQDGMHCT